MRWRTDKSQFRRFPISGEGREGEGIRELGGVETTMGRRAPVESTRPNSIQLWDRHDFSPVESAEGQSEVITISEVSPSTCRYTEKE